MTVTDVMLLAVRLVKVDSWFGSCVLGRLILALNKELLSRITEKLKENLKTEYRNKWKIPFNHVISRGLALAIFV